ncbi:MAG: hypothetical protein M0Z55_07150, partial [Peptococcaceae bacterium]|nr:hypothetical protein [Peptococcaceae bacterium]
LDHLTPLAQRLLLLLESQPVYNEDIYIKAVNNVLDKYLQYVIEDPKRQAVFLLNDTIRYFRSICVNYQYTCWKEEEKWTLRNIKLRHSRVIMYAGLLLLIVNASKKDEDKLGYIRKHIRYTPIERIVHVYQDNDDHNFQKVLECYDLFLKKISDKDIRESLRGIDYSERYSNPYYKELKVNSDKLQTELTRFILANRHNWAPEIFEYLIF